ncbi:MAG: ABC transporter substrate-binding protein [Elusimicrobia bacterium]|nr:ABC transporter substrate-binding protein [Elusimicrobiota bacterium]
MKPFAKLLIIALFFLSACSGGKPELVFSVGGAPHELDFWEELIADFESKTNIKVRIVRQPIDTDQRRQSILIPLKAKIKNPDIFLMDIAWIPQFSASNWLENLQPHMKQDNYDLGHFWANMLKSADTYKGNLIALPVFIDAGVFYYRKDLLKKYGFKGPPKYWDELLKMSDKIQKGERKNNPKFFAFVWQGAQYEGLICDFLEFASLEGGGFQIGENGVEVDNDANRQAADLMNNLIHKYKVSPPNTFTDMKEEQVRRYFQSGNALFERNWPYAWGLHQKTDSPVEGKIGIAPIPAFRGGKSFSTLGGWHVGISKYSDKKKEAWAFAKYMVSKDVQKQIALRLGFNPSRKDLYSDKDILAEYPHFKSLAKVFENAKARPSIPYYTPVSDVLQRHINSIVADKVESSSALKEAEKEIIAIVERYK